MSGAASFVLGLLGLGASAGINAGQSIKQKKAVHKAVEEMGYVGTPDVLRMRERVRKEWWDMCGNHYNACKKCKLDYGDPWKTPMCYLTKRWFIAHLNEKGIPYDDVVVNDVTGVTYYLHQNEISRKWMQKLR
ncbi:MAG: hypothetical protein ACLS3U_10945 [Lachnospiraceae bacterium]|jgi:hypothetical protein